MKKIILFFNVLVFFGMVNAKAALISDIDNVEISKKEANTLLKTAPLNAQLDLLKDSKNLETKLGQLYLKKVITKQGRDMLLSATEKETLDSLINQFYFKLKLKQISTQNLPDFEPLVKLEYLAKRNTFTTPEKVAVEHILIGIEKRTDKEALALAKKIRTRLVKGEDFTQLAQEFSDDLSVKNNQGKLGLFAKGKMVKPFEKAVYSLKLNELSQPVKTDFGYHILRKYEHEKAGYQSYAEVKEQLTNRVKQEYIKSRLDNYYDQIKIDNKMRLDHDAINTFVMQKTEQLNKALADELEKSELDKK